MDSTTSLIFIILLVKTTTTTTTKTKASAQISLRSFLQSLDFQNFSHVLSLKQLVLSPMASTSVLGLIYDEVVELYFCSALHSTLIVYDNWKPML